MNSLRKKRVSKKLKSSWRKHVNINDVDEFLEDKRLEERLGPPLSTVSDADLFTVDTIPDDKIKNRLVSKKERKLRALRPVKCFSALVPHTKTPDPISKRNRVRTKEERKNELIKRKEQTYKEKGILKPREIQSISDRRLHEIKKEKKEKPGEFNKDIWNEVHKFPIENDEWASLRTKKHNLRGTGIAVKNIRKTPKEKISPLPSVEAPHPGMSYNPSFVDHQNLLSTIVEKEKKIIKEEEHLKRVTGGMFRKITNVRKDAEWLVQMSEGLPSKSMNAEDETSDNEYKAINAPVKNKKKTLQQRRKQKEQLLLEKNRKTLKREKKKVGDINRIKVLQSNILSVEKKQEKLREKRDKIKELKKNEPKVLSSTKYEEPEAEFNFGKDLSGNLRNIKKEGSLLLDRFKSLQKRNILEPSKKRVSKSAKVKRLVKPGHKGDWESTVARKRRDVKTT